MFQLCICISFLSNDNVCVCGGEDQIWASVCVCLCVCVGYSTGIQQLDKLKYTIDQLGSTLCM